MNIVLMEPLSVSGKIIETLAALCDSPSNVPGLARPRRQEIFACFNRYRNLQL